MSGRKERELKGNPAANESQFDDIKSKTTVVSVISEEDFPRYQEIAKSLGFEAEIVAFAGEYYLRGEVINLVHAFEDAQNLEEFRQILAIRPVVSKIPVQEGFVAVSITKPAHEPDHHTFIEALKKQK